MIQLLVILCAPAALAVGGCSGAPEAAAKRLLYVTHSAGYRHDVLPLSGQVVRELARSSGAFEVTVTDDAGPVSRDGLQGYDAVFFYTSGELPLSDAQKQALLDFVKSGRGFAAAHSGTDTFYQWPAYGEMLGGYFDGHPWHQEVTVRVEDAQHPATRHLPGQFTITDEIYQFRDWSRDRVHVLLTLDPASVDLSAEGVRRTDRDFALAWTRRYGEGRVFYTALGHRPEVWRDERFRLHLLGGLLWALGAAEQQEPPGRETGSSESGDWRPLFDGKTTTGWRGYRSDRVPDGWQVVDGALTLVGKGGDIITTESFRDFELELEWKVPPGGNSGVFYRVDETAKLIWHHAHEMQVLDNEGHKDGITPATSAGSVYALYAPARDVSRPAGEWNQARVVARGAHVEHWLNGEKILEFEVGSPDWKARVEASKFRAHPGFGRAEAGPIGLQDHDDRVQFRNIRIRALPPRP
jgi:uncharacterized protein